MTHNIEIRIDANNYVSEDQHNGDQISVARNSKTDEFPTSKDLFEAFQLDYKTTCDLVGYLTNSYSRFLVTSLVILGSIFGLGILKSMEIVFFFIPYISMLILAIDNHVRGNLWFNYRYMLLIQEKINEFLNHDVFLFGTYFSPKIFYGSFNMRLLVWYRSLITAGVYFFVNLYSMRHVCRNILDITKNEILINYYIPVTMILFYATTFIWFWFARKQLLEYDKMIHKKVLKIRQRTDSHENE